MKTLLSAAAAVMALPAMANAHFLLEYTTDTMIEKPGDVPVKLIFWHPFENGHVMDLEKPQEFYVIHNGEKTDLLDTLEPIRFTGGQNEGAAFKGSVPVKRSGDYVLVTVPQPYYEESEDIYIQQLTKAFLNRNELPTDWMNPVGLPTEIVPLNKPTNIIAGSTFTGRVLANGQPFAGAEIEIEYMALRPQPVDRLIDGARTSRLMQLALAEPHVEVHVEQFERRLNLGQLPGVGELARDQDRLSARQVAQVGALDESPRAELGDVRAGVCALRRRLAECRGQHRLAERVDLGARVVDVELARHRRARGREHAAQRVAERSPAGVADVEGAGRVRRDELEVDDLAREGVIAPVLVTLLDDRARELAGGTGLQTDVEKPGAGDLDGGDALDREDARLELLGERARGHPESFRPLERDRGRPIAVIAIARTLESDVVDRERDSLTGVASLDRALDDGEQSGGEVGGIHDCRSYRAGGVLSPARPVRSDSRPTPARRRPARRTRARSNRAA